MKQKRIVLIYSLTLSSLLAIPLHAQSKKSNTKKIDEIYGKKNSHKKKTKDVKAERFDAPSYISKEYPAACSNPCEAPPCLSKNDCQLRRVESTLDELVELTESCCETTGSSLDIVTSLVENIDDQSCSCIEAESSLINSNIDSLTSLQQSCCDINQNTNSTLDDLVTLNESCCETTGSSLDIVTSLVENIDDQACSCVEESTNIILSAIDTIDDQSCSCIEAESSLINSNIDSLTSLQQSCCDINQNTNSTLDDLVGLSESCCSVTTESLSLMDDVVTSCCDITSGTSSTLDELVNLTESCCDVTHTIESIVEVNSSLLEDINISDLSNLTNLVESCCDHTGSNLDSLADLVESCCEYTNSLLDVNNSLIDAIETGSGSCCCGTEITASDIGIGGVYTISSPGLYCLTEDVTTTTGSAITISSSDVILDLRDHLINGSGTTTNAISALTVNNIIIKNGTIIEMLTGISVAQVRENLQLDNLNIIAHPTLASFNGLSIVSCSDVRITNTLVQDFGSSGIFISNGVPDRNIKLDNTNIIDCGGAGLSIQGGFGVQCSNALIQGCTGDGILFSAGGDSIFDNLFLEGNGGEGIEINDSSNIDIKNSNALNNNNGFVTTISSAGNTCFNISYFQCQAKNNDQKGFFSLISLAGQNLTPLRMFDISHRECSAQDNNNTGFDVEITASTFATSSVDGFTYIQCIAQNNTSGGFETFSNPGGSGQSDAITNFVYDECLAEGSGTPAGNRSGFTLFHDEMVLRNCIAVSNTESGIRVEGNNTTLTGCIASHNSLHGINDSGAGTFLTTITNCIANYNGSIGITTVTDSTVTFCETISNATGISSTGTGATKVYGNISSNNGANYVGGGIPLVTSPPGAADGKWINASVT